MHKDLKCGRLASCDIHQTMCNFHHPDETGVLRQLTCQIKCLLRNAMAEMLFDLAPHLQCDRVLMEYLSNRALFLDVLHNRSQDRRGNNAAIFAKVKHRQDPRILEDCFMTLDLIHEAVVLIICTNCLNPEL